MKKVCSRCNEEKVLEEFGKDKSRKDGYASTCKGCCKKYREERKDKIQEIAKRYKEITQTYREEAKMKRTRNI